MITMKVGGKEFFTLPEGMTLNINGSSDAVGQAYILNTTVPGNNSLQTYNLTGTNSPIGPFIGDRKFEVTCSVGTLTINQVLAITGTAANFSDGEVPSGAIPGTNFTLANAPSPAASLILVRNGVVQVQGVDYALAGNTITYTVAMASGDTHAAWYRY